MKKLILILVILFVGCEDTKSPTESDTPPPVENDGPTIIVESPTPGQTLSGEVLISVTTQDNDGIAKVEFFINDSLYFTNNESPYEYTWNTLSEINGTFVINIVSYDSLSNSSELGDITIHILNTIDSSMICNNQYSNIDGSLISCDTQCFESWFECYHLNDLSVLESFQQGFESLNNTILLDIGTQVWVGGRLVNLEMQNDSLIGVIPEIIGNLSALIELNLSYNELSGEIPESIGDLSKLEKLYLNNNNLSNSIPERVSQDGKTSFGRIHQFITAKIH